MLLEQTRSAVETALELQNLHFKGFNFKALSNCYLSLFNQSNQ